MSETLRLVVTPHFAVRPDQLARLAAAHPSVDVRFVDTPEDFADALPDADAAVTSYDIPADLLAAAARLRWLQYMGAGVERWLTPEMRRVGIAITAAKGPMGVLMAEHVVALLLALARDLGTFVRDQERRYWRPFQERRPFFELSGKTIAVVGVGSVGSEVARICGLGLCMRVLGVSRTRRDAPHVDQFFERERLHDALAEADIVALTLPLTPATEGIMDTGAFAALKPGALLINVARGQLMDEDALIESLRSGRLAGAGLDAFAVEPLPRTSPLWTMPKVIITPHTSAITERLGDHFVDFFLDNVRRFVEGQPLRGLVDTAAGY